MKILMVNKFFYIKGGSETYYFALKRLLESKGHTVIDFSMKDEKNFPSEYEKYFVDNVDYDVGGGVKEKVRIARNIIYSSEAKKKFEDIVAAEHPDIVHLHIFQHQISPSILDVLKKYKIPCTYTAHDLKMLCLNYKMMHHGKICEDCKGGKYYKCALNRCVKDSFSKSCINVAEGYLHKIRKSYDAIDMIITPSDFYRDKFIEFGVSENRVVSIPNFLDRKCPTVNISQDHEEYYLYFGRISEEKGIFTFLKAVKIANVKAKIVGTGPLIDEVKEFIRLNDMHNVSALGFKSGNELNDIVGNAKAVVLPSEWYENGPYSAIEALQLGRPIIGADIGGIPELVVDNGCLFVSGSANSLIESINEMEHLSAEEYDTLKKNSMKLFKKMYTSEDHYAAIEEVYRRVCSSF